MCKTKRRGGNMYEKKSSVKKLIAVWSLNVFFILLISAAQLMLFASEQPVREADARQQKTALIPDSNITYLEKATNLYQYTVLDRNEKALGPVGELLIDVSSATIPYIAFSFERDGEEVLIPVHVTSLMLNRERKTFILGLDGEVVFSDAPFLVNCELPDTILQGTGQEKDRYGFWYNLAPMTHGPDGFLPIMSLWNPFVYRAGARIIPGISATLSAVMEMGVTWEQDRFVGEVEDLIVNPVTGRIHYVLLRPEQFSSRDQQNQVVPIPLCFFTLNFNEKILSFDADPKTLRYAPTVDIHQWRNLTSIEGRRDVLSYWAHMNNPRPLRAGMRILPQETIRFTEITGYRVANPQGANLGVVKDVVIDELGNAMYAVVQFGGILGIGDGWHFVPLSALTIDTYRNQAILDVDKGTLEKMPGYEPGSIPNGGKEGWDMEIRSSWERWTLSSFPEEWFQHNASGSIIGTTAVLASRVMNYKVCNPDRKDLGNVVDIMLNMREAKIVYNVLSFGGGTLDFGNKLFAVPFNVMILNTYGEEIIFNIGKDILEIAPGFENDKWPTEANPLWYGDVDTFWQAPLSSHYPRGGRKETFHENHKWS
jgi:sporulation protein YlmC with PRC-barrel domain